MANGVGSTVATPSKAVKAKQDEWDTTKALLDGTAAMRAASTKFLPQWPAEEGDSYQKRLKVTTLFPAFKRTVATLASRPFSKEVTLDKVPADITGLLENVDLQGRNLAQFGNDALNLQLGYGFGGILVDHKRNPAPGQTTIADEKQLGLRPYAILVYPKSVLGWRYEVSDDEYALTQLRILEEVDEPDGPWATKCVEQVRVLEPGSWATFRKRETTSQVQAVTGADEWVPYEDGVTTLTYIPFIPLYGERLGFMDGRSPLLELAYLNVKHWQSSSDQDNLLHVARAPILTITGVIEDANAPWRMEIGANSTVKLRDNQKLAYVEHTGAAIGAGKIALDDLKEEMRHSGAELLVIKPGLKTATEISADNAIGMCDLQRITLSLQDALDAMLEFMGEWMGKGENVDVGNVKLFTDFGAATLSDASSQMVLSMTNAGIISKKTALTEQKRRGVLAAEVDYEEEQSLIEAEGPPVGKTDPITGLPYTAPVVPQAKGSGTMQ